LGKASRDDGRLAMTVRVDKAKLNTLRRKFGEQIAFGGVGAAL
jgi:hypothetical protein